jgi:hypothetical protein
MLLHEEQSGRFLRRPKQDYPAATVAEFCTAVLTLPSLNSCNSANMTLYNGIITDLRHAMHITTLAEGGQFEPRKIAAAL